jgi:hypothetical protein
MRALVKLPKYEEATLTSPQNHESAEARSIAFSSSLDEDVAMKSHDPQHPVADVFANWRMGRADP